MGYTDLATLKSYAGFTGTGEDTLLADLILSAQAIIENHTQRVFEIGAETDVSFSRLNLPQESRFDGSTLYFYEEMADEASAITDSPTVTYLPEDGPPYYGMYKTDGSWAYPTVTITSYWGYSKAVPADIEMACLRLCKWLYDSKDTATGSSAIITPEGQVLLPQGLPSDVVQILKPYRRITSV